MLRFFSLMSGQRRIIENGAIAVRGERIVAVGTRAEIDRNWQPARRIDRPNGLLAPGLITFAVDLPLPITLALEVLGLVGNWWLRRERQRRLKAITTWDPADAR